MKITIQCDICKNCAVVSALPKKLAVVRDQLEAQGFYCTANEFKDGKTKELILTCEKCKNYTYLSFD